MAAMVTVGVNLLWLVPGVVGGSEEYTLRLLGALDQLGVADDLWLRLYGSSDLFEAHPHLARQFETRVSPVGSRSKGVRIGAENSWLAAVSRNDDLVHHAGGVVPFVRSQTSVLTIHDLQPLEMPGNFSPLKRRWLGSMLPRSVRAARLVLCPSEFTAGTITERLGVPPERVRVVRHGHEPTEPGVLDAGADAALTARYGRYLLLPAIAYAHKRHVDAVAALDRLRDRFGDLHLVCTGRPGPETPALERLISELALTDRVHLLGRVPADELDALYRSAAALVFPSAYEGFGNPALEAMARGCPVVATTAGALPEVVGDAGLLVPPGRPGALAAAVARVLDEPGLAERLRAEGPARADRFSWLRAGRELATAYRDALEGR
ncbi:MAG: glycosyltransferase family 1 protein [Acidimicrobiales bacterium]